MSDTEWFAEAIRRLDSAILLLTARVDKLEPREQWFVARASSTSPIRFVKLAPGETPPGMGATSSFCVPVPPEVFE